MKLAKQIEYNSENIFEVRVDLKEDESDLLYQFTSEMKLVYDNSFGLNYTVSFAECVVLNLSEFSKTRTHEFKPREQKLLFKYSVEFLELT